MALEMAMEPEDEEIEVGQVGLGSETFGVTPIEVINKQRERAKSGLEQAFKLGEQRLLDARGPSGAERAFTFAENVLRTPAGPGVGNSLAVIASALGSDQRGQREQRELAETRRAELELDRAKALSGYDFKYDELSAKYGADAAKRDAASGRAKTYMTQNPLGQTVQVDVYSDGRTVRTNLDTGAVDTKTSGQAAVGSGAPPMETPAEQDAPRTGQTYNVFGKPVRVGDIIEGPDGDQYQIMSGGVPKKVAGQAKGEVRPATPQEAVMHGYAGPGVFNPVTKEFKPNPGIPTLVEQDNFFKVADDMTKGWDNVISKANDAINLAGIDSTGVIGVAQSAMPRTNAFALSTVLETIKSNVGFDKLQNMRDLSPTGGALGQVAVQELEALQASIASLNQGLDPERLKSNLKDVIDRYDAYKAARRKAAAAFELYRRRAQSPDSAAPAAKRLRFNPQTGTFE